MEKAVKDEDENVIVDPYGHLIAAMGVFLADLDAGEGDVMFDKNFTEASYLLQLDVLRDWAEILLDKYGTIEAAYFESLEKTGRPKLRLVK